MSNGSGRRVQRRHVGEDAGPGHIGRPVGRVVRSVCERFVVVEAIDDKPSDPSRRHPRVGEPLLIPRVGSRQQAIEGLAHQVGCPTIAVPAASVGWQFGQPMFESGDDEHGLILDPETHALQWNVGDRSVGLRQRTDYGRMPRIRTDRDQLTGAALRRLTEQTLALQREGGGSILKAASFFAAAPGTPARDFDLRVQEAAARLFDEQGMEEPHQLSPITRRRELYGTIAVPIEVTRSPDARRTLINSYSGLPVDGYEVVLVGYHHDADPEDILAGTSFLVELGAVVDRPVISQCPGHLAHLLLSSGISCSIGLGTSERSRMEPVDARAQGPISRAAYHPKLMRSYQLPAKKVSGRTSKRVFTELRCDCGEHEPGLPPSNAALPAHTLRARAGAFEESMTESDRSARLVADRASLVEATHIAAEIDVPHFSIAAADAFLTAALGEDEHQRAA